MFHQKGHGHTIDSWVSTGRNRAIAPDDVENVLGRERVQEFAAEAGISEQEARTSLSTMLPQLIDKLTPDGKLPGDDAIVSELAEKFRRQ
jgi:uncharacterized protein YidB (DUF937 family)